MEEPYPAITSGDGERGYATGYALRKGGSFNRKYYANGGGYTAAVCFRAAEALLNYMEASYLLNGTLDATAREYWTVLRQRAGISTDFDKTIAATDMSKRLKMIGEPIRVEVSSLTRLCIISVVNVVASSWLKVFATWTCAVGVLWTN